MNSNVPFWIFLPALRQITIIIVFFFCSLYSSSKSFFFVCCKYFFWQAINWLPLWIDLKCTYYYFYCNFCVCVLCFIWGVGSFAKTTMIVGLLYAYNFYFCCNAYPSQIVVIIAIIRNLLVVFFLLVKKIAQDNKKQNKNKQKAKKSYKKSCQTANDLF